MEFLSSKGNCTGSSGSTLVKIPHAYPDTMEKPYSCGYYGRSFPLSDSLKTHIRPYSCGHCGRCFALPDSLKNHMEVHKDETKYKCTTSNDSATQEINHLKEGKSVHTGGEQCNHDSTGASSNLSPGAKKYRRVHTGKCIRRFAGIYAYCQDFIDRKR